MRLLLCRPRALRSYKSLYCKHLTHYSSGAPMRPGGPGIFSCLSPPLDGPDYVWQDVGLHFAFVAYFIHNAIIRIWTPIRSLQFMFTKFVHNFLKIGDLLVTQEDTWLQACPHLLTARPYLFCWLFQECLSKELSEIMFPGSPFFSSVLLSLALCSPLLHREGSVE